MINAVNKPVIVLGAGGHAKVIAEALNLSGVTILGFITPDKESGDKFCGLKVLGNDSVITKYDRDEIVLANGLGALPGHTMRWSLARQMRDWGYRFTAVIHPSAIISSSVTLAEGVQIMAGSVIQPNVKLGLDSIVNTGVLLDHDCNVSDNCHLAPGVVCSGDVIVKKNVHIGTGTKIIQGISIGENSVVAAGSILYKNVPANITFKQGCCD